MNDESASEKSFEPTPQKLVRLRNDGEFARFPDVYATMGIFGFCVSSVFLGMQVWEKLGSTFVMILGMDFSGGVGTQYISDSFSLLRLFVWSAFSSLFLFFGIPVMCVALGILSHQGLVFSPSKVAFKLSRISILQNAKSKFGLSGLFDFGKNVFKLALFSFIFVVFLVYNQDLIYSTLQLSARQAIVRICYLSSMFFAGLLLCMFVVSIADAFFKYFEHIRKNRMTRQELLDENKESEGDPHLKQERRSRAQAAAAANMLRDVSTAEVVIVNPTHYAVALAWSREVGSAPRCVAKGVDKMALRMREIAQDFSVAIYEDPKTARALYAFTDLGEEISPEYYEAVAAAIQFAERMSERVSS